MGGCKKPEYGPNSKRITEYKKGDILIGNIRPYLKKIWYADRDGGCSGDVLVVRIKQEYSSKILPEFLYFLLASEAFFSFSNRYAKGGKMPRGDRKAILSYKICVPSVDIQQDIIVKLNKFSALTSSLSEGLPAEIEARRKQYEYYRDKLLTFPVKNNGCL
ncbi:restriction endonuclease subunit S [Actinotignum urinale]|uniref:restriction endonuclease subunit S n=1 Tax=Actinotignum urinale TaxID=190146 RepID=UPI002A814173|nr:restriction endonuclease subunit S [Actinotignum urinale]MDY5128677.1 restriction endonuclease subunit S [Actinotignum urinale]